MKGISINKNYGISDAEHNTQLSYKKFACNVLSFFFSILFFVLRIYLVIVDFDALENIKTI